MRHGVQILASYTVGPRDRHFLGFETAVARPWMPFNWHRDYGNANWEYPASFVASVV